MSLNDLKRNRPGMARIGKIRLGYMLRKCTHCNRGTRAKLETCEHCGQKNPTPEKREMYPVSTSHFVLDDVPELIEVYGAKPTFLNIWFPFNSLDDSMPSAHKLHSASSVLCIGDGEKISYAINAQTGKPIVRDVALVDYSETNIEGEKVEFRKGEGVPCSGYKHDLYRKCAFCKPSTTLKFLIREIPRFAYYEITTGSITNYTRLDEQLSYFTAPKSEGGMGVGLKGIPFRLSLAPEMISVPNLDRNGNPKNGEPPKKRVEKHLLKLEIDPDWIRQLMAVQSQLAAPSRLLLDAPATVNEPDDYLLVEDEFNQDEIKVIELTASPVEEMEDLEKTDFFDRAKDKLGVLPVVAGHILVEVGLINGKGYEKRRTGEYWKVVETTGADLQRFVSKVLAKVPYYTSASQVIKFLKGNEIAYDVENEEYIFEQLAAFAQREADKAAS